MSANIVGYSNVDGEAGEMAMNGVTFTGVATGTLSLDEIKPLDYDYGDDLYNNDFVISWYENGGLNYAYWREELEETGKPGWGTQLSKKIEKTFLAGEAYWIDPNGGLSAPYVVTSGQVTDSGDEFNVLNFLVAGEMSQVANPIAGIATELADVAPWDNVYEDDLYNNDFVISWYENGGLHYAYWREELEETGKPGWGTQLSEKVDHTFPAGGGFWVDPNGGLEEPVLKFKNPLHTAK